MMFARRIFIDIYISMFMALTLLFFALSERYPERRRLFLALMYVSVGLGVLDQGTGRRAASRSGLRRLSRGPSRAARAPRRCDPARHRRSCSRSSCPGTRRSISGTAGPTSRRSSSARTSRGTPAASVSSRTAACCSTLPVMLSDSFPLSLSLIPAAVVWFVDAAPRAGRSGSRMRTLLWLWIVVIVGFFSLSAAKQDLYIFPIVPAIAALAGIAIARAFDERSNGGAVRTAVGWTSIADRRQLCRDRHRARLSRPHGRRSLFARRRDVDWRRRHHRRAGYRPVHCSEVAWPRRSSRCWPWPSPSTGSSCCARCQVSRPTSRCQGSRICCANGPAPAISSLRTTWRCPAWFTTCAGTWRGLRSVTARRAPSVEAGGLRGVDGR